MPRQEPVLKRAVPAALLLALALLGWHTWAHWGSLRIDCGREVYVPAQLLQGKLLYRDLWYPYGPLAPYLQALLFRIFGVRLEVMYGFGLVLAYASSLVLYRIGRRLLSELASFLIAFVFLLQAFAPRLFNFIFGYSYSASLGALLGLLCLHLLLRHVAREPGPNLALSALVAGLAALCKQEFGIACWSTLGFTVLAEAVFAGGGKQLGRSLVACLPGVAVAVVGYAYFVSRLTLGFLLYENFQVTPGSVFFRTYGPLWVRQHGLRFVPKELAMTIVTALLALGAWYALARLWRGAFIRRSPALAVAGALASLALVGYGLALGPRVSLIYKTLTVFPIGMFWLTLGLWLSGSVAFARNPKSRESLVRAVVACYGLAAGIRIMVQVVPSGYAIYYNAIPFLAFVFWLTRVIERACLGLDKRRGALLAAGLIGLEGVALSAFIFPRVDPSKLPLATGVGSIYASAAEAQVFSEIAAFMRREQAAGRRVAVMPDEVLLYVAAGTQAPTRWYQMTAGILGSEQERQFIAALEERPVDYLVVTNRYSPELGAPYFGLDYYPTIYRWMQSRYRTVGEFGHFERAPRAPFSALLLERLPEEPAPAASLDVAEGLEAADRIGLERRPSPGALVSNGEKQAQLVQ